MKKLALSKISASIVLLCATPQTLSAASAFYDLGSLGSTGPSGKDWDGYAGSNNASGFDEYILDGESAGNGDQFYYNTGSGTGASEGRYESVVRTDSPVLPGTDRYVVTGLTPSSPTAHSFTAANREQLNIGRNTYLDNISQSDFEIEVKFNAASYSGAGADQFGVLLGYDHSIGGLSSGGDGSAPQGALREGFKIGVSASGVHFTAFGIADSLFSTSLSTGVDYTVRLLATDNAANSANSDYEVFLTSLGSTISLGTQTFRDVNVVSSVDALTDPQHGGDHLNNWYIGAGGTGQYFDGSISTLGVTDVVAVPEPSSSAILGLSACALLIRRKRR